MDLILDTCGVLALSGLAEKSLSDICLSRIRTADRVFISSCSLFEIAIKNKKQMLSIDRFSTPQEYWITVIEKYDLTELPVTGSIFYESVLLPDHHADPFDRIIIAESKQRQSPIVTLDGHFEKYQVRILW